MKKIVLLSLLALPALAQKAAPTAAQKPALSRPALAAPAALAPLARPRLVVGIVVDQMRYDYLYRYWSKFGAGGFRRLLGQGFSFETCHYNFVPTYTAPGHSSIYTGTTPATNGIVGNNWFVRETGRPTYCTDDKTVQAVGGSTAAGQMSPRLLLSTTITDELRLATNFQSKVIGVCIKDRGSILPAGHAASAAYWYDGTNGAFITSTFYAKELPGWVQKFNAAGHAARYLSQPWTTLLPIGQYTESSPDDVPWEVPYKGEEKPVFPHELPRLSGTLPAGVVATKAASGEKPSGAPTQNLDLIRSTPFGNSLTCDFALETLRQEQMGQRPGQTDFLALSFSSTDYVGHQFGTTAIETEDTYLRLDRDLARLLTAIDKQAGAGQALVFLTADHGADQAAAFLQAHRLPGGGVSAAAVRDTLTRTLVRRHGPGQWLLDFENQQVYLNRPLLAQKNLKLTDFQDEVAEILRAQPHITQAITATALQANASTTGLNRYQTNGFYAPRSGDVLCVLDPGYLEGSGPVLRGTTHGASWAYDTHVPLLFWGWHVPHGESARAVEVVDIAPTVARFLHIQEPSGNSGVPLLEVLK